MGNSLDLEELKDDPRRERSMELYCNPLPNEEAEVVVVDNEHRVENSRLWITAQRLERVLLIRFKEKS